MKTTDLNLEGDIGRLIATQGGWDRTDILHTFGYGRGGNKPDPRGVVDLSDLDLDPPML